MTATVDYDHIALSLRALTNVAIGQPESAVVNFNALHTLLNAIINYLGIPEVPVHVANSNYKDDSYFPVVPEKKNLYAQLQAAAANGKKPRSGGALSAGADPLLYDRVAPTGVPPGLPSTGNLSLNEEDAKKAASNRRQPSAPAKSGGQSTVSSAPTSGQMPPSEVPQDNSKEGKLGEGAAQAGQGQGVDEKQPKKKWPRHRQSIQPDNLHTAPSPTLSDQAQSKDNFSKTDMFTAPEFFYLQNKVSQLEDQYEDLQRLPSTMELLATESHEEKDKPPKRSIADMFKYMQLSEKTAGNEKMIEKVSVFGHLGKIP